MLLSFAFQPAVPKYNSNHFQSGELASCLAIQRLGSVLSSLVDMVLVIM